MKKHFLFLFLVPFLCFHGCKSAKKSLKRGDFDDSVLRATEKLKSAPNNLSSLDILKVAYPSALEQHLDEIERSKNSADPFHYEKEVEGYAILNKLFEAINGCSACNKAVKAQNFQNEELRARKDAALVRYTEGEKLLAIGDRESARKAYEYFEIVNTLFHDYREVNKKLEVAFAIATFKVVVEQVLVTSKKYRLSNVYFQEKINEFLQTNKRINKFVRFYTPEEAIDIKLKPDHVIILQFDDFIVGQTLIERNTETVTSKDSVKVSERTVGRTKVPVYGKVTAKLTRSKKTVHSSGLLDMRIEDDQSRRIVNQEKFQGEYNWVCEWANYNGDERALTPAEVRMCKSQELYPPAPQQLFIEFSKPIYDRLTNRLRTFYSKY